MLLLNEKVMSILIKQMQLYYFISQEMQEHWKLQQYLFTNMTKKLVLDVLKMNEI